MPRGRGGGFATGRRSDGFPPPHGRASLARMSTPLTTIRNIGPAMAEAMVRAGIGSAEDLRSLGTDAAYRRLIDSGHRPHFIAYYVIEMGLQGRPWNDCKGAEKEALRRRFDALKAAGGREGFGELERVLDAIGVVARPRKPTAP